MTGETTTDERTESGFDFDAKRLGLYATLALLVGFFLGPIEMGLVTSLKSDPTAGVPFLPPSASGLTFEKWGTAFEALSSGLFNSVIMAVPATVFSALLGSMAAYGLTQISWKGQIPILSLFVAAIFIPYQAVLVPLTQFWSIYFPLTDLLWFVWAGLGISEEYGELLKLIITHIAYGIPICTILFRSFYKGMSEEMIEAARLDGASIRRIYRRIVLPLSTPMFAVVLIYQFTQIWNELLFALILISSGTSEAAPVTLVLAGLGESQEGLDFALRMAGALLTALPTLIVYVLFGEEFAEGAAT
ncbi:carbohydrate ABC transporter permease [Halostella sp. JP-L12]|uniref:carbohydrate ABC transporter permease n=1 Tax=Halostella TaxID=1843185 RepID=UPI000EF7CFC6|nr:MULTISPECIES: carbohydrate ABC transporter permease [Halostella]NHN48527.1 carbohydrate ABC transporter permease [Halostella sp. JP-L12]